MNVGRRRSRRLSGVSLRRPGAALRPSKIKSPALRFWLREGVVQDDPPGVDHGMLKNETQSRARISALDVQNCVKKEKEILKKPRRELKMCLQHRITAIK